MNIALFASGSSGNCALVSDGDTHILLDAGISARRIRAGLGAGCDGGRARGRARHA